MNPEYSNNTNTLDRAQYLNLAFVTLWIGIMLGQERTIVPLLAKAEFGISSATIAFSFLISFGVVKSIFNFIAGGLNDRYGRRKVLLLGWALGLPVPWLLMYVTNWSWIVFANFLLGAQQALTWTTTIVAQVDLAGPRRRGFSIGFNECMGYGGVALGAFLTGFLAEKFGMRPFPFIIGVAGSIAGVLSSLFVKDTREYCKREATAIDKAKLGLFEVLKHCLWEDRQLRFLCIAGVGARLLDGMVWVGVPVLLGIRGYSLSEIGIVTSVYLLTWCIFQWIIGTLSDAAGRRPAIIIGFLLSALGMLWINTAPSLVSEVLGAFVLGLGMGCLFPTIMAAVSDEAGPTWRASALGVFRLCMDGGYAVAALIIGFLVDVYGEITPGYVVMASALLLSISAFMGFRESLSVDHWAGIWRTSKLLYYTIPLKFLFLYAKVKGRLFDSFISKKRFTLKKNLISVFGHAKNEKEIKLILRKHFEFLEKVKMINVWIKLREFSNADRYCCIEGLHYLDSALSQRKGVILLSAHFGYPRLITYVLKKRKNNVWLVELTSSKNNDKVANFNHPGSILYGLLKVPQVEGLNDNTDFGTHFNVRPLIRLLQNNGILVILGDGFPALNFVTAKMLDQNVFLSTGTMSLARKAGAVVLPAFMVDYKNSMGVKLVIEKPIRLEKNKDQRRDLILDTRSFVGVLESYLYRYPYLYHWSAPENIFNRRIGTSEESLVTGKSLSGNVRKKESIFENDTRIK